MSSKASGKSDQTNPILTDIKKSSFIEKIFVTLSLIMIIIFPLVLLCCFRVVREYQRAVILRFGRVRANSPAGPGIIWVVPCTDSIMLIDIRTQSVQLPQTEVLTKDAVTVTVDAIANFHVQRPLNCLLNIQSHRHSTQLISMATLRNIITEYTLSELLSRREHISREVRKTVDKITVEWGVQMEQIEIKEVHLSVELQRAMAAETDGTRLANAKIIEAEGEIKTAENLKQASRLMMENPQVMLLRYLQTLNFIASQQTTSIFFPFPIEIPSPHG